MRGYPKFTLALPLEAINGGSAIITAKLKSRGLMKLD
jgi:hypothetical protein